jgi:hypothetical protein
MIKNFKKIKLIKFQNGKNKVSFYGGDSNQNNKEKVVNLYLLNNKMTEFNAMVAVVNLILMSHKSIYQIV